MLLVEFRSPSSTQSDFFSVFNNIANATGQRIVPSHSFFVRLPGRNLGQTGTSSHKIRERNLAGAGGGEGSFRNLNRRQTGK